MLIKYRDEYTGIEIVEQVPFGVELWEKDKRKTRVPKYIEIKIKKQELKNTHYSVLQRDQLLARYKRALTKDGKLRIIKYGVY